MEIVGEKIMFIRQKCLHSTSHAKGFESVSSLTSFWASFAKTW